MCVAKRDRMGGVKARSKGKWEGEQGPPKYHGSTDTTRAGTTHQSLDGLKQGKKFDPDHGLRTLAKSTNLRRHTSEFTSRYPDTPQITVGFDATNIYSPQA